MAVTVDKYELPICVEDTATLLSKKMQINRRQIYDMISKNTNGRYLGFRVIKVELKEL